MSSIEVWYAIPSANPELCRKTLPVWREMGYRIAVLQNYEEGRIPADITVWRDSYPGWAQSINILCKEVVPKSASIVVSGGDDMLPDPHTPAHAIARQFMDRFPDGFGVMQPQGDAYMEAEHYCGSPWLGRGWIDRMYHGRGPMWGGYTHNWADLELFWLAKGLDALWQRPDLAQHHEHFWRTGEGKPKYWSNNVEPKDRADVQLFIARSWQNFPGHEPLAGAKHTKSPVFNPTPMREDTKRLAERHWMNMYGGAGLGDTWNTRMTGALQRCADQGMKRVALFGAGTHTKGLGASLRNPPATVVAIIDENPDLRGTTLWNYPIVSLEDALTLNLDAVILSSNSMEERLLESALPLRDRGVQVIRLYEGERGMWRGDRDERIRGPIESADRKRDTAAA
ncbi:MAG: hypothetical protein KF684_00735 [Phycisphaeraceae bacterium]|nr:hypothetical protein [Phycisphaeraceae bacterium]